MMSKLKLISIGLILLVFSGCSTYPFQGLFDSDGALIVLDEVHYRNHQGDKFHFHTNTTMSTGEVLYLMACTSNKTVHFTAFELLASANPILLEFYEGPTVTSNGTLATAPHNSNRNSDNNSTMTIYLNPTIASDGDLLTRRAILGAQNKITGVTQSGAEWILANDTCYTYKITNNDGNNVDIFGNFFWYEEE